MTGNSPEKAAILAKHYRGADKGVGRVLLREGRGSRKQSQSALVLCRFQSFQSFFWSCGGGAHRKGRPQPWKGLWLPQDTKPLHGITACTRAYARLCLCVFL